MSLGADGAACVISLATQQCERILPGHPPGRPLHVAWDPFRGYLGVLCPGGASAGAALGASPRGDLFEREDEGGLGGSPGEDLLVLWDLQSGTLSEFLLFGWALNGNLSIVTLLGIGKPSYEYENDTFCAILRKLSPKKRAIGASNYGQDQKLKFLTLYHPCFYLYQ